MNIWPMFDGGHVVMWSKSYKDYLKEPVKIDNIY